MRRELRALRAGAGMTQQDLAAKLGVTNISVSRWESGKAIPSPKYIKKMAEMFGVAGKDIFFNLVTTKVDKNSDKVTQQFVKMEMLMMFTYKLQSKENNAATISLDGSYENDVYVPAQQERDEDFSSFTLQEVVR